MDGRRSIRRYLLTLAAALALVGSGLGVVALTRSPTPVTCLPAV